MTVLGPPFESSRFCWVPGLEPGRNQFVSFERRFRLDRETSAVLHLFADTRYRLWVDGRFVAYGPGKFVTESPEYDTHRLELGSGEHVVRVEVNFYGSSSYQTMPDGRPGFLAAGGTDDGSACFDTPGEWRSRVHRCWDPEAPLFSFAQNPVEICDLRVLQRELEGDAEGAVETLPADRCPWREVRPRSAPYPDYRPIRPARASVVGTLRPALRWGFTVRHPSFLQGDRRSQRHDCLFATQIWSPRDQTVAMEIFWSDLWLNGEPLHPRYEGPLGNHGWAEARLRQGWNRLVGRFEVLTEHWSYLLGFPVESGVGLHARPDRSVGEAFLLLGPSRPDELPDPATAGPEGWRLVAGSASEAAPGRWVAWEEPDDGSAARDVPLGEAPRELPLGTGAVWCLDFADEFFGHPLLEVEAPRGTILDVSYDDWRREDGCVRLYGSNPFVDATDRFVLPGGRTRVHVLNPRGGIFLQLTFHAPGGAEGAACAVHDVAVLRRTVLPEPEGRFRCGDETLDWAWRTSLHTLRASTDESYSDCPWRERGSYIGDDWVALRLHRLCTADLRVALRTFDLFGRAQLEDGQLPCCAPAWLRQPHEDFSLIWLLAVRDLADSEEGPAFLARQWPVIERLWSSSRWRTDPETGLWNADGLRMFVDWGVVRSEREGRANAALNAFRVEAHRATADIAAALGMTEASRRHADHAERVAEAMLRHLWLEPEGRFAASLGAGTPALHANILALAFRIGPGDRLLRYLEPLLERNLERGLAEGQDAGHAELYFLSYLLPALAEVGRPDLAESLLAGHYGYLRSLGLPTLPECFHRADRGGGSCCHSWSGAAAIYLTAYVLGLRRPDPFQPDRWVLHPIAHGVAGAEGSVPHRLGLIEASWRRVADGIEASVAAPPGVEVVPGPGVRLLPRPS
ncbi:MAG: hypothetical protein ACK41F_06755 [Fimbriimonadaceae bacterium]